MDRDEPPFVGRDDQVRQARQMLRGGGIVLVGPAGIGKSRLLGRILDKEERDGALVHRLRAGQGLSDIPMGVFAPLLDHATEDAEDQLGLLVRGSRALRTGSSARRVVLGVDDAHHLDSLSAALIAQSIEDDRVVPALACRAGQVDNSIVDLWSRGAATRVDVRPLTPDDLQEICVVCYGRPLDRPSLARIVDLTAGNPLFIQELLRSADQSGQLEPVEDLLHYRSGSVRSERLTDLLLAHRSTLSQPALDALDALACAAAPLPGALCRGLFGSGVDELERARVIEVETASAATVRIAHPLVEECTAGLLAMNEQREILGRLSDRAAATATADAISIALWHLRSDRSGGLDRLTAGAQAALGRFDPALAVRLAKAAVAGGGGFEQELLLARARTAVEPADHADLHRLLETAVGGGTDGHVRAAAQALMRHLMFERGASDAAFDVADRALDVVENRHDREALLAERAMVVIYSRDIRSVIPDLAPIVEDPTSEPATRFAAHAALAVAYSFSGQSARAIRNERQWRSLLVQLQVVDTPVPRMPASARAVAHMHAGDLPAMHRIIDRNKQELNAIGETEHAAVFEINRGAALAVFGRIAEGAATTEPAVEVLRRWDPFRLLPFGLSLLGYTFSLLERLDEARAVLDECAALPEAYRRPAEHYRYWGEAWLEAANGGRSSAIANLRSAAACARQMGSTIYQAEMLHDLVRLGVSTAAIRRELAGIVVGFDDDIVARLHAQHADAFAAADPEALERVAAEYESRTSILNAADAWGQAATAYEKNQTMAASVKAHERALDLLRQAGVSATPATRSTFAALTQREDEVARLASSGMTNREIAERLGTSKRTVDNQLGSIYRKLGLSGRHQLGEAFDAGADLE